jgi:pimeloyl-[acyl-carrier protein] methyl ester esterase
MSRLPLVLLHGWGFDAYLWDKVALLLGDAPVIRQERGYFGARADDARPQGAFIAVGHSLGAMRAARLWPDVPLVAINGFDRFCGPDGVAPRVLARMARRLADDPDAVLGEFRARLGADKAPPVVDRLALARDLALLAQETPAAPRQAPLLVLQAQDDPLLPEALRRGAFGGHAPQMLAQGGHLLPLTQPEWCAAQIGAFAP